MKNKIMGIAMFLSLVLPSYMYAWKFTWRNLTNDTLVVKLEERTGALSWRCKGKVHERTVQPGKDAEVETTCCIKRFLVQGPAETRRWWYNRIGSDCGGTLKVEKGYDQLQSKEFYKVNNNPSRLQ